MYTFISGERVILLPENEEVQFVGTLKGQPMVTGESRGVFFTEWKNLQKIEDQDRSSLVQGTDPAPPGFTPNPAEQVTEEIENEIQGLADIVNQPEEPAPETGTAAEDVETELRRRLDVHERNSPLRQTTTLPDIPKRVTQKWLSGLSDVQLSALIENADISPDRLKKLEGEQKARQQT